MNNKNNLAEKKIAVIGLGYVGLPLAVEFGKIRNVIGFDNSKIRIRFEIIIIIFIQSKVKVINKEVKSVFLDYLWLENRRKFQPRQTM